MDGDTTTPSLLRRLRHLTRELRREITEASAEPAGRFLPVRRLHAAVKKIDRAIAESTPKHVCPYCKGQGCKACKGGGRITEVAYLAAPKDLKK